MKIRGFNQIKKWQQIAPENELYYFRKKIGGLGAL